MVGGDLRAVHIVDAAAGNRMAKMMFWMNLLVLVGLCLGQQPQQASASLGDGWSPRYLPVSSPGRPYRPASEQQCDATLRGMEEWIFTPNYPSDYDNYRTCTYLVKKISSDVCTIDMTFVDFDLEDSDNCINDYLQLPDGQRLCGTLASETQKTVTVPRGTNVVTFTFASNREKTSKGFMIKLKQNTQSCTGHNDYPPVLPPPVTSPQTSQNAGCDQILSDQTNRVKSPGYPRGYGPGLRCRYTIRRMNSRVCRIQIMFKRFDVESSYGCRKDYLELPDRTKLCGRFMGSKVYEFNQDTISLYFVTDSYRSGFGFEFEVRQLPDSCLQPAEQRSCDRLVTKETDIIRSPEYPSDYPPGAYCVYTIKKANPSVCSVTLDLIEFDVEEGTDCDADALIIETSGERLCGGKSSTKKSIQFLHGQNSMKLVFTSDHTTARKGFEIKVTQSQDPCTKPLIGEESGICGRLRASSGIFESSNHPYSYGPNTNCFYWIHKSAPEVCRVELFFTKFDVGSYATSHCPTDYVEIQGTKYCGRRDGQTLLLDFPQGKDQLGLFFHTDDNYEKSGFRIEIQQHSAGCQQPSNQFETCDQLIAKEEFQLVSPGFRSGGYPPNSDCVYTIRKFNFKVCALEVRLDAFDLEEDDDCSKDYLEINDVRLCGKQSYGSTRTFEFLNDELKVKFHSNPTVHKAGFFLSAKQIMC